MRSRLAFKKVRPEDWGLRQKASQVYARGGLAGTGTPTTRFQPSTGMLRVHHRRLPHRAYSCRAAPNERGQRRTLPCRDRAVWVGHAAASAVLAGEYEICDSGASGLRLREAHARCQGFGVAVIVEVAVA